MRYYLIFATAFFIILSWFVKTVPYFPLDLAISKSVQTINFPGFKSSMTFFSNSGWGMTLYSSLALIALSLFLLRKKLAALFIILISILDTGLFFGIANLVNRPRPSPDLIKVDFPIKVGGFPSGHVLLYTLIFGFLIYLTVINVKNSVLKFVMIIVFSCLIILIGVARIYSGQHWPSDIFAGYLLGSIGLAVSVFFYNLIKGREWSVFPKRDHRVRESQ